MGLQATKTPAKPLEDITAKRLGLQAGAELVSAIAGGVLLGWGADSWWGTKPLFLIVGLILGFATAIYNIYRITSGIGTSVGLRGAKKDAK